MSGYDLVDQADRDRFTGEVDRNFSVIAPAGVGKTRAIVERIMAILEEAGSEVEVRAGELVVVTYTQKAAEEMRERTRLELIRRGHGEAMLRALGRAFFGTIHSFCLKLIRDEGVSLGLAPGLSLCEDIDVLWRRFLRERDDFTHGIDLEVTKRAKQLVGLEKALNLGKVLGPGLYKELEVPHPAMGVEWDLVLEYATEGRNKAKIIEGKAVLRNWIAAYEGGVEGIGLPEFGYGGAEFKAVWAEMVQPLWQAANSAARYLGAKVAADFLEYRQREGVITYDDMVYLAGALMKDPAVRSRVQGMGYRVILDEAQDTDAVQFEILLACASDSENRVKSGHFSMVGDPQQSIYSGRADVGYYLELHKRLLSNNELEALKFVVTMRCDGAIVDAANGKFPKILDSTRGQVAYVPLEARPWAGKGQVSRLVVRNESESSVAQLADFLKRADLAGLGVESWSEVAILAPRKAWLMEIKHAIEAAGLKAQVHSRGDVQGDHPVYAWIAALLKIIAEPHNGFELYGFLREVYGVKDSALAEYQEVHGLNTGEGHEGRGEIGEILHYLYTIREESQGHSLLRTCQMLLRGLGMQERLGALAEIEGFDTEGMLADFYQLAIEVEGDGGGIGELSALLERGFDRPSAGETPESDAVQLYTCHKSKGLEWKVVIVAEMFRKVAYPVMAYPRVYGEREVVITSHPGKERLDSEKNRTQDAEMGRLLYVAATRAKEHLIYMDDAEVWEKHTGSMAEYLGVEENGKNRSHWEQLPEVQVLETTPQPVEIREFEPPRSIPANATADNFPRRKTPSSLVQHGGSFQGAPAEASGGTVYGDFWHGLMEHLPWSAGLEVIEARAQEAIEGSEHQERAQVEISHLLRSDLFQKMTTPGAKVYTEVPFVHSSIDGALYEGVMDAILVDDAGKVWVIDWKTDNVESLQGLHKYGLQVGVYVEALRKNSANEVLGLLYSSKLGQSIEVDFEPEMA